MTLPTITATGNVGGDPELSWTPSGKAVCNISVGCNQNKKNQAGEWETVSTTWLRVQLWDQAAEAAAEAIQKGDQVMVTGQLDVRDYETKDGNKGKSVEVKFATIAKVVRGGSGGGPRPAQRTQAAPADDLWGTGGSSTPAPF